MDTYSFIKNVNILVSKIEYITKTAHLTDELDKLMELHGALDKLLSMVSLVQNEKNAIHNLKLEIQRYKNQIEALKNQIKTSENNINKHATKITQDKEVVTSLKNKIDKIKDEIVALLEACKNNNIQSSQHEFEAKEAANEAKQNALAASEAANYAFGDFRVENGRLLVSYSGSIKGVSLTDDKRLVITY